MLPRLLNRSRGASRALSTDAKRGAAKFVGFNWEDPLNMNSLLTDEEVMVRDSAHSYCEWRLLEMRLLCRCR